MSLFLASRESDRTDTWSVPDGWQVINLGHVASIAEGQVDPRDPAYASLPHIGPEDVEPATGRLLNHRTVGDLGLISGKYLFQPGDVVYSKIRPYLRKCVFAAFRGLCSADMYPLKVRDGFDPRYLHYFTLTDRFTNQAISQQDRTGIPKLNREQLSRILIATPALREQQAIAAVLSRIYAAVEAQEKILAALKELKAATMAKLFREGLRGEPLKQTEIGEIPESWEIIELAKLCTDPDGFIQTGPFGSQLHASDYVPDGVPIVNPTHIDGSRIRHAAIPRVSPDDAVRLQRHKLRLGDILFSRRGDVGRHGHVFQEEEGWLCGTGCLIVRVSRDAIHPLYLSYFLSTSFAQEFLKGKAVGSIMPNINTKILAAVVVPRPPHADQLHIAEILRRLDDAVESAAARRDGLRALFSTVLHRLMTGEVRLSGARREPNLDSPWFKAGDVWEFVGRLVRKFDPERVILFGSRAWGAPTGDSDVDLLVVMEFEGRPVEMAVRIGAECDDRFPMDLIVRRPAEVERRIAMGDPFFKQILRDGLVLHERAA